MTSIFLDTNVPMCAAGGRHPLREPSVDILRLAQQWPNSFMTSAEVLQEILHRYLSINRWREGRIVLRQFSRLLRGRIQPVFSHDVLRASELADQYPSLESRDYVHAAVMFRLGIRQIVSTDQRFDSIPGIERLDPMKVDEWRDSVAP